MKGLRCCLAAAIAIVPLSCASAPPPQAPSPASPSAPPATASAAPGSPPSATSAKVDFKALAARELAPLSTRSFAVGAFTLETEATGEPKVTEGEDSFVIDIPIGTETALKCFAYKKPIDPAGQISNVLASIKTAPSLEVREVGVDEIFAVGSAPTALLEAIYLVKKPEGSLLGDAKLLLVAHAGGALLCMHDELGYVKSLRRIASGLAVSLEKATGEPEGTEAWTASVAAHPIGFLQRTVGHDEEGHELSTETISLFIRQPTGTMSFLDLVDRESCDWGGRLLVEARVVGKDGKVDAKYVVKKVGHGAYTAETTKEGETSSAKYTSKDPSGLLCSRQAEERAGRELLKGNGKSFDYERFDENNANAFEKVHATLASRADRTIHLEMTKHELVETVDGEGRPSYMTDSGANGQMVLDRIFPSSRATAQP